MSTQSSPPQLSGYSYPLSPSGQSAMVSPPPWHFSGNMLWIDCNVDPEAAASFLPGGLSPTDDPGAAAVVFSEWQWCSAEGSELADPVRCQFSEFQILLACEYRGRLMARCPYAWVDSAVSLARGWIQGMPKQYGSVQMTRMLPVGPAGGRREPGGQISGSLAVHDRRLAEATALLTGPASGPPELASVPLVHSKVVSPWTGDEDTTPRLLTSRVTGVEFSEVWSGTVDLRFDEQGVRAVDEALAALIPRQVGRAHSFAYAETLVGGEPLA
ncbi:acetoacetate decarboxylase family protein [Streptomyces physcomitrii]